MIKLGDPTTKSTISISFLHLLFFLPLFILGLNVARGIYTSLFGQPYEIGWVLLYFIGKVAGLALGLIGLLISGTISYLKLRKDFERGTKRLKIISVSYCLFTIWVLLLLATMDKLIPPCANCVR